ncbi:MAG TPA: type II and III secretion system protein family protein [Geminicoccaceae bacterium]|nr:type II and III secretion system protein family protein [Geminicoccaceae bacterium]
MRPGAILPLVQSLRRCGAVALAAWLLMAGEPAALAGGPVPEPSVGSQRSGAGAAVARIRVHADRHAGRVIVPVNQSQVLESDRPFNEVSVGNPEIADIVPLTVRSVYVFGKQLGTTSLTLTDARGGVLAVVDIVVTYDLDGLKAQLHELMPHQAIEVRPAADGIVVSGRVPSAAGAADVIAVASRYAPDKVTNLLRVTGSQQVMLAVRFAEVSRDVVKQLGFTTDFLFETDDFAARLRSGSGPSVSPPSFGLGAASLITGNIALDVLLDTLEDKGVIKTLAEPNLIALSGDTANFLAGGEFPVPVGRDENDGRTEITIEFKPFGVSLSFTPTVVTEDLINLQLLTEVSEVDTTNAVVLTDLLIPGLKVRRARTTVELRSGQSFAIAGMLQENFQDQIRQFPLLGDLPVLGALFRSTKYQKGQTELVVTVTPHLVQPASSRALLTPADTFVPPNEAELFLLGRPEGTIAPSGPGSAAAQLGRREAAGIVGPYGYILK